MPSSTSSRARFGLALLAVFFGTFLTAAHAQIVAFGAGNISGWNVAETQAMPAQLQSMLRADGYPIRVLNAGIYRNTTVDMRNRMESDIPSGTKIVVLDVTGDVDPQRHISPAQTAANLQAITAGLSARGITIITMNFSDVPTAYRQRDGWHLTPEGHKYVASQLLPQVTAALGPLAQAQPTTADVRDACRADAQRLCANVLGDEAKRRACMHDHRSELSKDCITAIVRSRQGG